MPGAVTLKSRGGWNLQDSIRLGFFKTRRPLAEAVKGARSASAAQHSPPRRGGKGGDARQAEGAGTRQKEGQAATPPPAGPPEARLEKPIRSPPKSDPAPREKWSAGLIGPRNPAEGGMPGEGGPGGGARRGGGGARRRGAGEQKGRESRSQQARQEKERKRERTERKRKVGENPTSSHKKTIDSYGGMRENEKGRRKGHAATMRGLSATKKHPEQFHRNKPEPGGETGI